MKHNRLEKRKWLLKVAVVLIAFHLMPVASAQAQTLREAFTAMPDSLLPTLTKNNRLDMMDFMDAKMKAAVTNKLDGETVMTFLGSDSLSVKMSDALTVEMTLQRVAEADTAAVVCLKRTYTTSTGERQTVVARYDARTWRELEPARVGDSTLRRIDDKVKTDVQ